MNGGDIRWFRLDAVRASWVKRRIPIVVAGNHAAEAVHSHKTVEAGCRGPYRLLHAAFSHLPSDAVVRHHIARREIDDGLEEFNLRACRLVLAPSLSSSSRSNSARNSTSLPQAESRGTGPFGLGRLNAGPKTSLILPNAARSRSPSRCPVGSLIQALARPNRA